VKPEIALSPALSLFARPGEVGVQTRRVAVLVADGVDLDGVQPLMARLTADGAVARLLGPHLGGVTTAAGDSVEIDAPIDAAPSVLWDAVIVPDGGTTDRRLADGRVLEFLKDQFRHCKPMLIIGSGEQLLNKAGIPVDLPDGGPDPGLLIQPADGVSIDAFITALTRHRHYERETDPPRV
jgi:catalase